MTKKTFSIQKLLPPYGWVCLGILIFSQAMTFYFTRLVLLALHIAPMSLATALDERIPFRPEWILIYVLAFATWAVTLVLLLRQRKEHVYRTMGAYLTTLALSAAFFLLLPGTIRRPEVTGRDFFSWLTRLIYALDPPNNLCPSLHVACNYYCWRALWDTEGIPRWYRRFNFVFLLLVCGSILLVKQHVLVDIPTAILVSELPLQLSKRFRWERLGYAVEKRIQNGREKRA